LNERYETWIGNYKLGKLLIFEVDDINIEENPADLAMIIEKVNAQLHGLF
jgi:deoxyadenosine/deoxycytidine kinase